MEFVVWFVAVMLGAVVQGAISFGLALVVVPALTLFLPEALPATVLLLVMPLAVVRAVRERRVIDVPGLVVRAPGPPGRNVRGRGASLVDT